MNQFYINGRGMRYSILDLYRDPQLCNCLNAKLFTKLKNDMKLYFHVTFKHPRYYKSHYWTQVFEMIRTQVSEEEFMTNGYHQTFTVDYDNYGKLRMVN